MHYIKDETKYDELKARGEEVEQFLQSTAHSEAEKAETMMDYLSLLNAERAAELGVTFTERVLEKVCSAFEAHPTADLAVDTLYACMLLQQFHVMQYDAWRAHPAIEQCRGALTVLEAEARWSDVLRYCQETANTYAEARWWPEALEYSCTAHRCVCTLLENGVKVLENGELLDPRDSAYSIIACSMHTAGGLKPELQELLRKELGAENLQDVIDEAQEAIEAEPAYDPVELTPEYLAIRSELEEKIDDALDHERGYYDYCREYWLAKRLLLRNEYGIRWQSPEVLNPGMDFEGDSL